MATSLTDSIRASIKRQLTAVPKPKHFTKQRRTSAGLWARPFASDALGVSPDQIPAATRNLRANGCMADYDKEGRLMITSDDQYRQAAKASGIWDGATGYGAKNDDGSRVLTGREQQKARDEFRAAVEHGDYDD